jgi:hypothetical protein
VTFAGGVGGITLGASANSTGSYIMSGGSLTIDTSDVIGEYGTATFSQTGGTQTFNSQAGLAIGLFANASGSYLLGSTATLAVTGNEYIGGFGIGVFNQTGGTNSVAYTSSLGQNSGTFALGAFGGTGTYILSGGLLSVPMTEALGGNYSGERGSIGTGIFTQTGGVNDCGALYVGYSADRVFFGCQGNYLLSAGTLAVSGSENVGGAYGLYGTFTQTGGTNTAGTLNIQPGGDGGGLFTLQGGLLAVSGGISCTNGVMTQTGGTLTYSTFENNGTVSVPAINLGNNANGTFFLNYAFLTCSSLQINASGTMLVALGNVSLNGNGVVNAGGTLSIVGNGALNLNDSTLTINYSSSSDPISTFFSYLQTGYKSGAWNGPGIDSSFVASHPGYGIGYADGADGIVPGLPSGEIEIAPTLVGDATLSGSVTFGDFSILAQYFGQSGGWDEGNFLYASTVNFADFIALVGNLPSAPITSSELASMDALAANSGDTLVPNSNGVGYQVIAEVPEPAGIAILAGITGAAWLRRRKRFQ